jgi:hypothetical protein
MEILDERKTLMPWCAVREGWMYKVTKRPTREEKRKAAEAEGARIAANLHVKITLRYGQNTKEAKVSCGLNWAQTMRELVQAWNPAQMKTWTFEMHQSRRFHQNTLMISSGRISSLKTEAMLLTSAVIPACAERQEHAPAAIMRGDRATTIRVWHETDRIGHAANQRRHE